MVTNRRACAGPCRRFLQKTFVAYLDGEAAVTPAAPFVHVGAGDLSDGTALLDQRQHVRLVFHHELTQSDGRKRDERDKQEENCTAPIRDDGRHATPRHAPPAYWLPSSFMVLALLGDSEDVYSTPLIALYHDFARPDQTLDAARINSPPARPITLTALVSTRS